MCVVSMISDHYIDKWGQYPVPTVTYPSTNQPIITVYPPAISPEEIAEFRRLLERAREYDRKNNEPECELADKVALLKQIAKALGVDLTEALK